MEAHAYANMDKEDEEEVKTYRAGPGVLCGENWGK